MTAIDITKAKGSSSGGGSSSDVLEISLPISADATLNVGDKAYFEDGELKNLDHAYLSADSARLSYSGSTASGERGVTVSLGADERFMVAVCPESLTGEGVSKTDERMFFDILDTVTGQRRTMRARYSSASSAYPYLVMHPTWVTSNDGKRTGLAIVVSTTGSQGLHPIILHAPDNDINNITVNGRQVDDYYTSSYINDTTVRSYTLSLAFDSANRLNLLYRSDKGNSTQMTHIRWDVDALDINRKYLATSNYTYAHAIAVTTGDNLLVVGNDGRINLYELTTTATSKFQLSHTGESVTNFKGKYVFPMGGNKFAVVYVDKHRIRVRHITVEEGDTWSITLDSSEDFTSPLGQNRERYLQYVDENYAYFVAYSTSGGANWKIPIVNGEWKLADIIETEVPTVARFLNFEQASPNCKSKFKYFGIIEATSIPFLSRALVLKAMNTPFENTLPVNEQRYLGEITVIEGNEATVYLNKRAGQLKANTQNLTPSANSDSLLVLSDDWVLQEINQYRYTENLNAFVADKLNGYSFEGIRYGYSAIAIADVSLFANVTGNSTLTRGYIQPFIDGIPQTKSGAHNLYNASYEVQAKASAAIHATTQWTSNNGSSGTISGYFTEDRII